MKYTVNIFLMTIAPVIATGVLMEMSIKQIAIYSGIALISQAILYFNQKP